MTVWTMLERGFTLLCYVYMFAGAFYIAWELLNGRNPFDVD